MAATLEKVRVQLAGPFRLVMPTGIECTPAGRKSCAILAILALAPDHRRSRVWLQERLWGSRGKEQGAASLRQSLVEIRKALGDYREALISDSFTIALAADFFAIDATGTAANDPEPALDQIEFLEGLDIVEEGFEEWLGEQRELFHARRANRNLHPTTPGRGTAGPATHKRQDGLAANINRLILTGVSTTNHDGSSLIINSLLDTIAKTVSELGAAKIIDWRSRPADHCAIDEHPLQCLTLSLRSEIAGTDANAAFRLALSELPSNEFIWSSVIKGRAQDITDPAEPSLLQCANQAVSIAIDRFLKRGSDPSERLVSSALCHSGVQYLFRLGKSNYEMADRLFARAYEMEARGIYLAWRAYLRTFLLAERQYTCRKTVDAEAFDFLRRAKDLEPHNSYVAALGSHVHSIMRRSYIAAYEMAESSISLNHANPIGWACLGMAKCYLGKPEEGFRDTLRARSIAGTAPYRFHLDALSCIAGSTAGRLDEAIHFGEASHALAPEFAAPLRYLSALYLHAGDYEQSHNTVNKLRAIEPDFCYEKLREKDYPAAGLRQTNILDRLPTRQV